MSLEHMNEEASRRAAVDSSTLGSPQCSSSFTYYVMSDGELMGFNERPEDAFDNEADVVFRRVSWTDEAALQPGYGKRIDEVVSMFPEVDNPQIGDGYRVKAEVTIGWLRCLNVLAGYLQGIQRVRNPEFRDMFYRSE